MRCETCGNEYERPLMIRQGDERTEHAFDSFECAIHAMAPTCAHCGCRIIGHGVELGDDRFACCANCARELGQGAAVDHPNGASEPAQTGPATTRPPSDS
jgi:hypothetical protein